MNDDDARLIRSSSLMGLGTIISRVTGLARNLLLVAVLGTGILGDAYNVANTTPNILYNLLAELYLLSLSRRLLNHSAITMVVALM